MPNCNVIGCGIKKNRNYPNLTLHKLPSNPKKRKLWLEEIGVENLKTTTKTIYICSLHFEEFSFNRTLDKIALHEDALPSKALLPSTREMSGKLTQKNQIQILPSSESSDPNVPSTREMSGMLIQKNQIQTLPSSESSVPNVQSTREMSGMLTQKNQIQTLPSSESSVPNVVETASEPIILNKSDAAIASGYVMGPSTSAATSVHVLTSVTKLKDRCRKQSRKIKRLNEKIRRQRKKIADFHNIITDLKQRNLLNLESEVFLNDCAGPRDFLKRQITKSRGLAVERKYSEEIRKFALTLHFFSTKAYEFVRSTYNTCLPHSRTLSKWNQHVNAEPGFCSEAFDTLKTKVQNSNLPVVCCLMFDEMSIRKSLCWDPQTQKYYGRVNCGVNFDNDAVDVANQCLVMLVNCINGRWKLPVGYFFITTLTGEQKKILVEMCVQKCEAAGVKVVSITCDGPAANFSMFSSLGCDLMKDQKVTNCRISQSNVHIFIDPCHVLKLIRNAFGEINIFFDNYGREVNFTYLEKLLLLQTNEDLHMGTKLTKAHLIFDKQKMKVRLATQLLSNSVADALHYCDNELHLTDFQGCEATVNFIRLVNNVFDVLNSRSIRPPGWKKAVCSANIGLIEALFEGAISYFQNLKLPSGQLLISSRRKTGFIGLIINMKSTIQLYKYLVEDQKLLKYVPLYKVSQDHIELFFSAIRARGGFNNNPNAVQFKAAFKRLLIRTEIRDGGVGSCIPLEQINILTCSSKIDPINTINDLTDKISFVEVLEDDSELYEGFLDCLYNNLSDYAESVITYIAGFVARKLTRRIKCETCTRMLHGDSMILTKSLIFCKSLGGLTYPSQDIVNIIKYVEKILKSVLKIIICKFLNI